MLLRARTRAQQSYERFVSLAFCTSDFHFKMVKNLNVFCHFDWNLEVKTLFFAKLWKLFFFNCPDFLVTVGKKDTSKHEWNVYNCTSYIFKFFIKIMSNNFYLLPVLPIWLCVRHLFFVRMVLARHENHPMDLDHLLALYSNRWYTMLPTATSLSNRKVLIKCTI